MPGGVGHSAWPARGVRDRMQRLQLLYRETVPTAHLVLLGWRRALHLPWHS